MITVTGSFLTMGTLLFNLQPSSYLKFGQLLFGQVHHFFPAPPFETTDPFYGILSHSSLLSVLPPATTSSLQPSFFFLFSLPSFPLSSLWNSLLQHFLLCAHLPRHSQTKNSSRILSVTHRDTVWINVHICT